MEDSASYYERGNFLSFDLDVRAYVEAEAARWQRLHLVKMQLHHKHLLAARYQLAVLQDAFALAEALKVRTARPPPPPTTHHPVPSRPFHAAPCPPCQPACPLLTRSRTTPAPLAAAMTSPSPQRAPCRHGWMGSIRDDPRAPAPARCIHMHMHCGHRRGVCVNTRLR